MNIAFSLSDTYFQENQNMALFPKPISSFWLYLSKKINRRFFFNQMLRNFKMEL